MSYTNNAAVLQFPSHYVPLTEEEMTYVDGGKVTYYDYRKGDKTGVRDLYSCAGVMATAAGLTALVSRASKAMIALNPGLAVVFKVVFAIASAYTGYLAEQFFAAAQTAEAMYKRSSYTVAINSIIGIKTSVNVI